MELVVSFDQQTILLYEKLYRAVESLWNRWRIPGIFKISQLVQPSGNLVSIYTPGPSLAERWDSIRTEPSHFPSKQRKVRFRHLVDSTKAATKMMDTLVHKHSKWKWSYRRRESASSVADSSVLCAGCSAIDVWAIVEAGSWNKLHKLAPDLIVKINA